MINTKKSDDIADFLIFLSETNGEEALRGRTGGKLQKIIEFQELARSPLPPLYLSYLREFGDKDGLLKMADDADARVKTLVEFYEERAQAPSPDTDVPVNGVAIGVYGLSGDRDLLYPSDAGLGDLLTESAEPSVVVAWGSDISHTYAQTFRNHLYRQAFIRGRFREGALFSLRRNDDRLLPSAAELVGSFGFHAYWFSDDYQSCLERDDGATLYIVGIPGRTSLYGCFKDEKARDQLKTNLIQQLNLEDSTPS